MSNPSVSDHPSQAPVHLSFCLGRLDPSVLTPRSMHGLHGGEQLNPELESRQKFPFTNIMLS